MAKVPKKDADDDDDCGSSGRGRDKKSKKEKKHKKDRDDSPKEARVKTPMQKASDLLSKISKDIGTVTEYRGQIEGKAVHQSLVAELENIRVALETHRTTVRKSMDEPSFRTAQTASVLKPVVDVFMALRPEMMTQVDLAKQVITRMNRKEKTTPRPARSMPTSCSRLCDDQRHLCRHL